MRPSSADSDGGFGDVFVEAVVAASLASEEEEVEYWNAEDGTAGLCLVRQFNVVVEARIGDADCAGRIVVEYAAAFDRVD